MIIIISFIEMLAEKENPLERTSILASKIKVRQGAFFGATRQAPCVEETSKRTLHEHKREVAKQTCHRPKTTTYIMWRQ